MDSYRSSRNRGAPFLNCLTVLFIVGALCVGGFTVLLFVNPGLLPDEWGLEPIPTLPPPPTSTPTAIQQAPPTWTLSPSDTPFATDTPESTLAPPPTDIPPTTTETPTIDPSSYSYILQEGTLNYIPNVIHPELGCNWSGVAGQVFDLSGSPVVGITILLGGSLDSQEVDLLSLTGTAVFMPGGYEFALAEKPIKSDRRAHV